MITSRRFGESSGNFNLQDLNNSLYTASWGILMIGTLQLILKHPFLTKLLSPKESPIPSHITETPKKLSLFITAFVILIAYFNFHVGFFRVGVASEITIPQPFSFLLYWILGPGAAFFLFLSTSKKYRGFDTFITIIAMACISISTISRNNLMYFAYPTFIKFINNIRQFKISFIHTSIIFVCFVLTLFAITQYRRSIYYSEEISITGPTESGKKGVNWLYTKGSIIELFLDRWVGIEGVLVANRNKSDDNFKTLFLEDIKINKISLFYDLSNSYYPTDGKHIFYNIPGPLGLLTFAKSTSLKFLSWIGYLSILALTFILIEKFLFNYSKSVISWWAASSVTQLSLFPIHNIKIYFAYLTMILFCVFIFHLKKQKNEI